MEKKGVGLNPSSQIHYTDHLAVVCIIMDIPLLFIDELDYSLGKKYYPGLKAEKIAYDAFQPEFLIANYDVLFLSDLWDRRTFHEKFASLEEKYHKILRHVHCPHGYSDKSFYLQKCANEDIALIYGQNMLDMLKECQVLQNLRHYVITGNYRYTFFKQHRDFYDRIMKDEVLSKFEKKQPVILYAPTWLDLEESTTFFDAHPYVLEQLPSNYNMIVKLHPRLELDDMAQYYHIVGRYENRLNILFLKDFPLIYPLLAHSDIYIGDMSSVGYDYLAFNKPMYFLNKQKRGSYLFRCGVDLQPEQFPNIYEVIEKTLPQDSANFSEIRHQVYAYTFSEEKPFSKIKEEIVAACQTKYNFS